MRSGCKGAAVAAAIGLFVFSGASASPVYTTVVLDDFEASSEDRRWAAQLGSSGHVVYFADTELRRWINGHTTVLHEIGTHLEGLAPGVTTTARKADYTRHGKLLGVDRHGGVSVYLLTDNEAGLHENVGLLASTTPDGGFRAVVAMDEVAAPTGVIRSTVSGRELGIMRSDDGYTAMMGRVNGVITMRVISPGLEDRIIVTDGDRTPDNDGTLRYDRVITGGYPALSGFGRAGLQHVGAGGVFASQMLYTVDGTSSWFPRRGVFRDTGSGPQTLIRGHGDGEYIIYSGGGFHPAMRINASGDVLVSAYIFTPSGFPNGPMLAIFRGGSQTPEVFAARGSDILPTNFPEIRVGSIGEFLGSYSLDFGDDGSVLFGFRRSGDVLMHRNPSGVYTVLLAEDANLLGSPGASVSTSHPSRHSLMASFDASSAAGLYLVNSTPTLFYATPDGLTRVAAVGESLEVAPGDVRQISGLELLDVNGPRVLFSAEFTDSSRGMFVMNADPGCPADLNNDGVVDADDFFLVLSFFAAGDPRADINGDGVIDADDFFEYLALFAQGC